MSGYELRAAVSGDFPALAALWELVFGDGADFTDEFFRTMWTPGCCRVAELGGKLAAMGFCLSGATALGRRCGYIYAMATHPEHRGHGLAAAIGRALVADAFGRGEDIVATLPAEESLNAWYATRLGMRGVFKKGGDGVLFPDNWQRFARFCGAHDPSTPDVLLATARAGVALEPFMGLGWEITLD